ncbi:MAG: 30S ribosomal protein S7 [Candidatus Marinimicrobia bacterium]|nr:30S ribosomal protein S7 [Candidatus Neomarinimicrobiota bacterium]|tara:strand:+ start:11545 stop:12012 length:468 start_codon:yes stop_codon:yes gene_type:complete
MRRRRPEKRKILQDPIYKDITVAKFVNYIMQDGKKSIAEKIFYNSLDIIKGQLKTDDPLDIFKKALNNVAPILEVKSKRIGGATYQVPMEVSSDRRMALAMRWILTYSKGRKGTNMSSKLAAELIAASNKEGSSIKKREDTHKMAEANKAFAHFR